MLATTSSERLPVLAFSLALLLAAALPARADDPAPPRLAGEAGLGLRHVGGEQVLSVQLLGGATNWLLEPTIETLEVEGWAAFSFRPSAAGRYRLQARYSRSADQAESKALTSGGEGLVYFQGTSTSRGTLQQAEVRLDASFPVSEVIELGPWTSFRHGQVDLTLSDTTETLSANGTSSSTFTAGPTHRYRDTSQAAWIGVAASWTVLPTLRLCAEAALSPWARDRYSVDNLVRTNLLTGDVEGSGWRAGAGVGWSPGGGHRLALTSSFERLSTSGAAALSAYAGPSQGASAAGQGELKQDLWDAALGWGYAF